MKSVNNTIDFNSTQKERERYGDSKGEREGGREKSRERRREGEKRENIDILTMISHF